MKTCTTVVTWKGSLKEGSGTIAPASNAFNVTFNYGTRFEAERGTNPEELIAAALASCYSMALAGRLSKAGHKPTDIETQADVTLSAHSGTFDISTVRLMTRADVLGMDRTTFEAIALDAKENCPVARLLKGAKIDFQATLKNLPEDQLSA